MNDALPTPESREAVALVLAGGLALGAFEAGAYAALEGAGLAASLECVAGSSIGAITATIIAGNESKDRITRLSQFWRGISSDPTPLTSFWLGQPTAGIWRQAHSQASVMQTLMLGRPGLFQPRLSSVPSIGVSDVPALFDLAPLRATLASLIDFDLLNSGSMRVVIAATDVLTGERVIFDTGSGDVIEPEHVLACCALMPVFAPVEIDGRLLADGGLASNVPLDVVLTGRAACSLRCFVVDLFAAEGSRPHTLAASASRAGDLAFGNQSRRLLEGIVREHRLRALISQMGSLLPPDLCGDPDLAAILAEGCNNPPKITYISYRAKLDEAGLGKTFDFSRLTVADRWEAGNRQMQVALDSMDLQIAEAQGAQEKPLTSTNDFVADTNSNAGI